MEDFIPHASNKYVIMKTPKPKKLVSSQKVPLCDDKQTRSASRVELKKPPQCRKKTTQSTSVIGHNNLSHNTQAPSRRSYKDKLNLTKGNLMKDQRKQVQQHYRNENFEPISESSAHFDTIVSDHDGKTKKSQDKVLDASKTSNEEDNIVKIYSKMSELQIDTDCPRVIKNIKDFRHDNYFECHSATSRIKSKGSVTSLIDHKCVYRFYLNERLFPVPLVTDHNNTVRCVECCLPMKLDKYNKINGSIQAKLKFNNEETLQDTTLLLPIQSTTVVAEKRKTKETNDVVYFGVIRMGDCVRTKVDGDSLALRYQKGYREMRQPETCHYEKIEDDDVIII